jgi:hypothetical protein
MVPRNQDRYSRDPNFQNKLPDGRRFATLGAGPEDGRLVGNPNRPTDVDDSKNNYRRELAIPENRTEDQMIAALFAADAGYNDKLDYDVLPAISDGYNSNSYARGMLDRAGFKAIPKLGYVPGYNKPIPSSSINKEIEKQKMSCIGSRIERTSC